MSQPPYQYPDHRPGNLDVAPSTVTGGLGRLWRRQSRTHRISLGIWAVLMVLGGVMMIVAWQGQPVTGDCLTGLDEEITGYPIVECDDPSAAWKVVGDATGERNDSDLGTCDGQPDGQRINTNVGRKSSWEMCVVPYGP
ncbi:hypothetical protein [Stackebrandtia soli]|uniref:LppU/SCO3897 family protein n=1 Tax=Stackebrandtia soli TaxID=1892856 RepID=UPI0039EB7DB3